MGSSYVKFQERGFWVRDGNLELWLHLMSSEVNLATEKQPEWLTELACEWRLAASVHFNGCVSACLDEFIRDLPDRRDVVVEVVRSTLERLSRIQFISAQELNRVRLSGETDWERDVPVGPVLKLGSFFELLLKGELEEFDNEDYTKDFFWF